MASLDRYVQCEVCHGEGSYCFEEGDPVECNNCGGLGEVAADWTEEENGSFY